MEPESIKLICAAGAMAIGSVGPALGIGMLARGAMEALGRNPESKSAIMTNMILAIAFCEAIAIYVLIVAIMILFLF